MKALRGIILRAVDYKEKDKLLTVATLEEGIVTVTAKGVRSQNAKLKALISIFTFGEFSLAEGKAGYLLNGVLVEDGFFALWKSAEKYAAAVLLSEVTEKSLRGAMDISGELLLFLKALREIAYGDSTPYAAALWYMVKLSEGFGIDYSVLNEGYEKATDCLHAFSVLDADEVGTYEGSLPEIFEAMKLLGALYRTEIGVTFPVLNEILKGSLEEV